MFGQFCLKTIGFSAVSKCPHRNLAYPDPESPKDLKNGHFEVQVSAGDSTKIARKPRFLLCGVPQSPLLGSSVKPYHPPGLWQEAGPQRYTQGKGEALYRRSLYTFWKRTVPPPTMLMFDGVSREVCVARRESTITPNQALVLLNDPTFIEAARVLATGTLESKDLNRAEQFTAIFRKLTGRSPLSAELEELTTAHQEQLTFFQGDPDDAKSYVSIGQSPVSDSVDAVELAAMTAVTQLIMNFHEFQMK